MLNGPYNDTVTQVSTLVLQSPVQSCSGIGVVADGADNAVSIHRPVDFHQDSSAQEGTWASNWIHLWPSHSAWYFVCCCLRGFYVGLLQVKARNYCCLLLVTSINWCSGWTMNFYCYCCSKSEWKKVFIPGATQWRINYHIILCKLSYQLLAVIYWGSSMGNS